MSDNKRLNQKLNALRRSVSSSRKAKKKEQHREELLAHDRQNHESKQHKSYVQAVPILEDITGTKNVIDLITKVQSLSDEADQASQQAPKDEADK